MRKRYALGLVLSAACVFFAGAYAEWRFQQSEYIIIHEYPEHPSRKYG